MDNRYILEQTSVGTRVGGADFNYRPGRSVLCDTRVPTAEKNGPMPVYTHGPVFYKLLMDGGSVSGVKGERTSPKGNGRILHEVEKVSAFFHVNFVRATPFAGKVICAHPSCGADTIKHATLCHYAVYL